MGNWIEGESRPRSCRASRIYGALTGVDDFENEAVEFDLGADVQIFRRVVFRHFVREKGLVGLLHLRSLEGMRKSMWFDGHDSTLVVDE